MKAKNGTAKSLRTLIESDAYPDIDRGIKLCDGNVGREGPVLTLPYLTAFLLRSHLTGKLSRAIGAKTPFWEEKVDENTRETIGYYDANAAGYVTDTADVEFGALQREFIRRLPEGGRVLDLGCGSGRDSLAFLRAGLAVDAVDGSARMVEAARELTGLPVTHATFSDYDPQGPYDGIWACSSLLHVPAAQLPGVISKYARALKLGGTFYLSFKLGFHDGMRGGRWFTDLDEPALRALITEVPGLRVDRVDVTGDARPGRSDEKWLNA